MPEITKYDFTHKELLKMLVREANITTGKWMLTVNLTFAAANVGPSDDMVVPSGIVGIAGVALTQAQPESPQALTIDAEAMNKTTPPRLPKRSR